MRAIQKIFIDLYRTHLELMNYAPQWMGSNILNKQLYDIFNFKLRISLRNILDLY